MSGDPFCVTHGFAPCRCHENRIRDDGPYTVFGLASTAAALRVRGFKTFCDFIDAYDRLMAGHAPLPPPSEPLS